MEGTDGPEGKEGWERTRALLARKKLSPALRRLRSQSSALAPSSPTSSNQSSRETKGADYRHANHRTQLEHKGSFMRDHQDGAKGESVDTCRTLLATGQEVPQDSLFRDDRFQSTCRSISNRSETRVFRDISLLIVPSAEILANCGEDHLRHLVESVKDAWNSSITFTKTRHRPDYAVGFKKSAFAAEQLAKLKAFVGCWTDTSFFMGTVLGTCTFPSSLVR